MDSICRLKDVKQEEILVLYKNISEFVQYLNKELEDTEKVGDQDVGRDK